MNVPNGKLHNVHHVLELETSLLLIAKLCQEYKIEFYKDMCYVIDPKHNKVIANDKLDNDNLFKFHEFSQSTYSLLPLISMLT